MSSPTLSTNVKERMSLDEEDNPITILLLANPVRRKSSFHGSFEGKDERIKVG